MVCKPLSVRPFAYIPRKSKRSAVLGDATKKKPHCAAFFHRSGFELAGKVLRDEIPVNQIPESRNIVGTPIAIIDVIGMLPYIAG